MRDRVVRRRRGPDLLLVMFSIIGAVLLVFIVLPLAATVLLGGPGDIFGAFTEPEVRSAIGTSFAAALIATALSLVFGIPLAYVLARVDFPGKGVVQSIMDVPIVIPHTISGIALLVVFGRMGVLGEGLDAVGLSLEDHLFGIVLAMMFVSAPFVVNHAREGFEAVDVRLEDVARSLGATRFEAFLTVTMPLSKSSLVTGATMAWARAVSEFGAVVIIATFPKTIPTLIYEKNLHTGLSESMPLAAALVLLCVGLFILFRSVIAFWKRRTEGAA